MRVHFLDSPVPIKGGVPLTANCGAVVPNAVMLFRNDWSKGECDSRLDSGCTKCRRIAQEPKGIRYTFGILSGEEALRYRIVPSEEA